ncbi:hypothetical protein EXS56_01015 [Candidatus Kaiserbacteria bacterium]|nr:hypothetical protein [Candidatus Kaiserbacteria bacterium]
MVDFKKFLAAVKAAMQELTYYEPSDSAFEALEVKQEGFDFFVDGGVDSLDVLDIMYLVGQKLKMRTVPDFEGTTAGQMYTAMCGVNKAE